MNGNENRESYTFHLLGLHNLIDEQLNDRRELLTRLGSLTKQPVTLKPVLVADSDCAPSLVQVYSYGGKKLKYVLNTASLPLLMVGGLVDPDHVTAVDGVPRCMCHSASGNKTGPRKQRAARPSAHDSGLGGGNVACMILASHA